MITKTNNEYSLELLNNKINIIPLEEYINAKTKILHRCVCGNEWLVAPNDIITGVKCGCTRGIKNRLTHKEYLTKLNDRNIRVLPLEEYINAHTKILHRCVCGNEWMINPQGVLKGNECSHNIIKNHKEYLTKLNDRNIKVVAIEEYIDAKTKILHRCVCGNEWNVLTSSILKGQKCGCKGTSKPISHNEYILKLKSKKINITPLEDYVNGSTKILHRCTCGNEWNVKPMSVLRGQTCGHDRVKNHKDYLAKLKGKGIEVYPLEEYINSNAKILHKCICGNEWTVKPMSVLDGDKCGCARRLSFRDEAFYKDKETILYYIKIDNLYKIGVTLFKTDIDTSLKKRFNKVKFDILQTETFKDGSEAFRLEQKIINANWSVKYKGEKILASGNSELFTEDIR